MLRSVAVILQEPVAAFEYGVVSEVFGVDRTDEGVPKFDYRVCGIEPGKPLNFTTGAQVIPQYGLEACADVDLVAIPAGQIRSDYPEAVLDVLRAADARGAYILSACTGSFIVAAAGLLQGRSASTHWKYGKEMSELFPDVDVNTDVLYVQEGQHHHQCRYSSRHRRQSAPGPHRARADDCEQDRPPHGGSSATRRRAEAVRESACAGM